MFYFALSQVSYLFKIPSFITKFINRLLFRKFFFLLFGGDANRAEAVDEEALYFAVGEVEDFGASKIKPTQPIPNLENSLLRTFLAFFTGIIGE